MKFSFSRAVEYVPAFQGNDKLPKEDQFIAKMKVLTQGEFLELAENMSDANEGRTDVDSEKMTPRQIRKMMAGSAALLTKYVTLVNLFGDDGVEVSIDEVAVHPAFLNLAAELTVKLAGISQPGAQDTKN